MSMKKIMGHLKCLLRPGGCSHTKKLLFEFVEGQLPPETHRKLEKHIGNCPPCLDYVKSYRHTIHVTHHHGLPETPMPPALKQKLREFIEQNPDLK
jgi:anti-sigma factor RsiW